MRGFVSSAGVTGSVTRVLGGAGHLDCPTCSATNSVTDMVTDQWVECENGCGTEWTLRRMLRKDDLLSPHTNC